MEKSNTCLPPLVKFSRLGTYISGSALLLGLGLPEQAMGWLTYPLGLELVAEDKTTKFFYALQDAPK